MKMNFNFKFKDSLAAPGQSIRDLTIACDQDHAVRFVA
jgi:hypothetical protein